MKIREIIPLIQSNPLFSKTPQQSSSTQRQQQSATHENNELTFSPKSLLSVNNQSSEIYYYSPIECKLYVIKVESTLENTIGSIKYQELKVKINFEVYKIELNEDSRYLCIVGHVNCIIVDLNPQTVCSYFTSQEIYSNEENKTYGYDQISVRNFTLDKTFYQSQISNIIKQVEWHPLSNIHLVILYSNNVLKIYNIQNEEIEQSFNLESLHTYETLKKVRNNDVRSLKQNTNKFISFCFGSNINFWTRFTIFLMNDSGEIYNLCPVVPNNCLIETNFYKDFQNHILCEKSQCDGNGDQQQQKYYEFQFKWLMASVNTTPFEIENTSWLKLTSPSNIFHPLLQGPIYKTSTTNKSTPLKLLSISPIISNLDQQQQQTVSTNTKLVPFIIIILLESCESLVNICCQDTIPMWSNENGIIFNEQDDQNTPKYIELILYETLDLNVKKYPKPNNNSSTSRNKRQQTDSGAASSLGYLSYSMPNMKYDQWSDSLYFYHNQGIQIAKFPWLVQIFLEINDHGSINGVGSGIGSNKEVDDDIKEFETTSLISVLSSGNECIPIIGIQVFSNIKIGTYFLVLPNTFKIVVFDMDGLIDQQKQQVQINDQSSSNDNQDDGSNDDDKAIMESPIQKYIDKPPPFIGRVTLSNSISPKEFLQVLVNTKKKLYNLYIYSSQLEIELQSRVKGLEIISENQKKLIDRLKQYIENLKVNQHALNTKLKYVWDKKEIDSLEINELHRVEMEGKPISNQENELNKTYKQINSQINIYSERLNQIEKDLDNSDNNQQQSNNSSSSTSSSFEEIPSDHQIEIKKVISEHAQKIEQDVIMLEKLLKTIL